MDVKCPNCETVWTQNSWDDTDLCESCRKVWQCPGCKNWYEPVFASEYCDDCHNNGIAPAK